VHRTQPKELQGLWQGTEVLSGCPSLQFGGCLSSLSPNNVNCATKPTVGISNTYTRFTNASAEYHGLVSYIFHLTNELALLLFGTRVFVKDLASHPTRDESSR